MHLGDDFGDCRRGGFPTAQIYLEVQEPIDLPMFGGWETAAPFGYRCRGKSFLVSAASSVDWNFRPR
jgi:hypothetical protein